MKQTLKIIIRDTVLVIMVLLTVATCVAPLPSPPHSLSTHQFDIEQKALAFTSLSTAERKYLQTVKRYSDKYEVDFRLILALIKRESRFVKDAVSERGAIGLMQIMPVTHAEIMDEIHMGDLSLPEHNIKAGIYYFAKLFDLFDFGSYDDRLRLTLASYYAGPYRMYDAQQIAAYMGEDPNSWSSIQNVLPLLSKRCYSLHELVWLEGKPRTGYFRDWQQTISYVENIMQDYDYYRSLM